MKKAVVLKTDGTINVIDHPDGYAELNYYYRNLGCSCIESVMPVNLYKVLMKDKKMLMIVDEEGRLKEHNEMNKIASYLYGAFVHGQPILGDVMFCQEGIVNGELCFVGLEEEEANQLKTDLGYLAEFLEIV